MSSDQSAALLSLMVPDAAALIAAEMEYGDAAKILTETGKRDGDGCLSLDGDGVKI